MLKTLIIGIEKPDRQKLAEFLLGKGYKVHAGCNEKVIDILRNNEDLEGKVVFHKIMNDDDVSSLIGKIKIDQAY